MHGRQDIVEIMLAGFEACRDKWSNHLDMRMFVVVSDYEDAAFLRERDIPYCIHPNSPVGIKWSLGMKNALARWNFDYALILGSDDVFHPELFNYYLHQIQEKRWYFGIAQIVIMHPDSERAKTFTIPPLNRIGLAGPGRMIHHTIINQFNGMLWPAVDKGLDMYSNMRITTMADPHLVVTSDQDGAMVFDIKSDTNIWPYDKITSYCENTSYHEQFNRLPEQCKRLIDERRIRQTI